jgi:hypothetical protein
MDTAVIFGLFSAKASPAVIAGMFAARLAHQEPVPLCRAELQRARLCNP